MKFEILKEIVDEAKEPEPENQDDEEKSDPGKMHLENESVAEPASGLNCFRGIFGMLAEFCAEGLDVGVDGAVHSGAGIVPGFFEKLVTGKDSAGFFEESGKELVFVRGEVEEVAAAGNTHRVGGMMEESGGCFGLLRPAASENSADTGHGGAG